MAFTVLTVVHAVAEACHNEEPEHVDLIEFLSDTGFKQLHQRTLQCCNVMYVTFLYDEEVQGGMSQLPLCPSLLRSIGS